MRIILIIVCLNVWVAFSQVQNIPADNTVYTFLKNMQVRGIIPAYDDILLPMSVTKVAEYLQVIESKNSELTPIEQQIAEDYLQKFASTFEPPRNSNFSSEWSHLIFYSDSSMTFTLSPLIRMKNMYSFDNKNALMLKIGGQTFGTYDNWFGFYLDGSNEVIWGDREVAKIDNQVAQSYTYNETGINYVDNTSGYLKLANKILSLQLGRERILMGTGYNERTILSNNPQLFDFIRFDFEYKVLNYKFIHGWLVQPPEYIPVDSTFSVKVKQPKYIAISRLGFNPVSDLKFGISQVIIYSNRPFEAAYLNPFLFWESAQRSMNDLDNSYLGLDARFLITSGIELSTSILFDDIHFGNLFQNGWNTVDNRNLWHAGLFISDPISFANISFNLDYIQIRPYMFSHPGIGEMLTYTNNGYVLGFPAEPNSSTFSFSFRAYLMNNLQIYGNYNYYIHGENVRSPDGELIKNVGGNVMEYHTVYDSDIINLLEGTLRYTHSLNFSITYEPAYFVYLYLNYIKNTNSSDLITFSATYQVF